MQPQSTRTHIVSVYCLLTNDMNSLFSVGISFISFFFFFCFSMKKYVFSFETFSLPSGQVNRSHDLKYLYVAGGRRSLCFYAIWLRAYGCVAAWWVYVFQLSAYAVVAHSPTRREFNICCRRFCRDVANFVYLYGLLSSIFKGEHRFAAGKVSRKAMCGKTDMFETYVIQGFSVWQSHMCIIWWFKCKNLRINKKDRRECDGMVNQVHVFFMGGYFLLGFSYGEVYSLGLNTCIILMVDNIYISIEITFIPHHMRTKYQLGNFALSS